MKWRIVTAGRFYDAGEGQVVYFDPYSGDTHLLSDFAAFVVQQFEDRPLGTEQLVGKIQPRVDTSDLAELAATVRTMVEELSALDILQRA